jgi:branched-chain amino acid transport system ATP-binding protein
VSLGGVKEVFRDPYSARVKGVAYIPQGGRVFGALTVRENLLLGGSIIRSQGLLRERLANAYGRFAVLSSKRSMRAAALSGGERQMLALATGLMIAPRVLLVDEPTLGLAPKIARESLEQLREFAHAGGVSILVVEQKVREVLSTADRVYALKQGRIVFCSQGGSSFDYASLRDVYL